MDWLTTSLLVLAGLVLAAWAHYRYWVARLRLPLEYAMTRRLPTPDGGAIELRRLPPPPTPELPPVLLVHGVGANHRNVDAEEGRSLARLLHERGRDVYLVTLRSGVDRRGRAKVSFEAMAANDVPTAVDAVLEDSCADQIDYVGFSMGGMLLYAVLGAGRLGGRIRRAAVIGSPGRIEPPWRWLRWLGMVPPWSLPPLYFRFGARMIAFAAERIRTPIHSLIYNHENCAPGSVARAMVNMVQSVPAALHADVARWARHDGEILFEGQPVLDGLDELGVPCLFLAGGADRIAPPTSVHAAFEAWGRRTEAPAKRWIVLDGYGHGDLAIGRNVDVDVNRHIAEWLDERDAARRSDRDVSGR